MSFKPGDNIHVQKHWTATIGGVTVAAAEIGYKTLYYGVAHVPQISTNWED